MSNRLYYSAKRTGSFLILLSFLLVNPACLKPAPQSPAADLIFTRQLTHQYGSISGPPFDEYFSYLAHRLTDTLPAPPRLSILLINTPHAYATSLSNGTIIVSKGLLLKLDNEAELAFVVAHELSHLRHLGRELLSNNTSQPLTSSAEQELAADREALGIVALAGYDPRAALAALNKSYKPALEATSSGIASAPESRAGYPALGERVSAALRYIQASNWHPPGIIDRRDFQKIREALRKIG